MGARYSEPMGDILIGITPPVSSEFAPVQSSEEPVVCYANQGKKTIGILNRILLNQILLEVRGNLTCSVSSTHTHEVAPHLFDLRALSSEALASKAQACALSPPIAFLNERESHSDSMMHNRTRKNWLLHE
ncbi:hypothetical protein STEG23_034488 [Scotinomys teguina]